MDKELQSKLVEILGSIQTAAGKAGDFALSQLPDIAQSYVTYGRAYTLAIAIVGFAVFCGGFWAIRCVNKRVRAADAAFQAELADYKAREAAHMELMKSAAYPSGFYSSSPHRGHYFEASDPWPAQYAPFVLGTLILMMNASQLFLVWFAPKVWLLRELTSLVK